MRGLWTRSLPCVCVCVTVRTRACVCKLAVVIGYRAVPFTIRLMSELVQISSKIAAHSFTGYEIKRRCAANRTSRRCLLQPWTHFGQAPELLVHSSNGLGWTDIIPKQDGRCYSRSLVRLFACQSTRQLPPASFFVTNNDDVNSNINNNNQIPTPPAQHLGWHRITISESENDIGDWRLATVVAVVAASSSSWELGGVRGLGRDDARRPTATSLTTTAAAPRRTTGRRGGRARCPATSSTKCATSPPTSSGSPPIPRAARSPCGTRALPRGEGGQLLPAP